MSTEDDEYWIDISWLGSPYQVLQSITPHGPTRFRHRRWRLSSDRHCRIGDGELRFKAAESDEDWTPGLPWEEKKS